MKIKNLFKHMFSPFNMKRGIIIEGCPGTGMSHYIPKYARKYIDLFMNIKKKI